jgi:hypothetical protein
LLTQALHLKLAYQLTNKDKHNGKFNFIRPNNEKVAVGKWPSYSLLFGRAVTRFHLLA